MRCVNPVSFQCLIKALTVGDLVESRRCHVNRKFCCLSQSSVTVSVTRKCVVTATSPVFCLEFPVHCTGTGRYRVFGVPGYPGVPRVPGTR
eukprot:1018121-Rhodomonas_salina.1